MLLHGSSGAPWYRQSHPGIDIASWGREAVLTAEAVLVASLSTHEDLRTAPDNFFVMISFAAVWMVMAKFAMFQTASERLPGVSNGLLVKIIERLTQLALTPDHTPAKCAQLINKSMTALESRTVGLGHTESKEAAVVGHAVSSERSSSSQFILPDSAVFLTDKQYPMDMLSAEPQQDFKGFMNPDMLFDSDFWSSFTHNLSSFPMNKVFFKI